MGRNGAPGNGIPTKGLPMSLSRQHGFLFIHIPKVAGMSIHATLDLILYSPPRILVHNLITQLANEARFRLVASLGLRTGMYVYDGMKKIASWPLSLINVYPPHVTAQEWRQKLTPAVFDSLFKFAFVRNPWDLHVSMYHYILQQQKHPLHALIKGLGSFGQYVQWLVACEPDLQKNYLVDENDEFLVDFVGRFERLNMDFEHVCRLLNLSGVQLRHVNGSAHKPYQDYYNGHTRKLIEEHYRDDIETFGYTFDTEKLHPLRPRVKSNHMPVEAGKQT
jgi:hypothetical protein